MRAAYRLALAVFSVGAVATPTMAPNVVDPATTTSAIPSHAIPDAVRNIAADLSAQLNVNREGSLVVSLNQGMSIGESLPESVEVHLSQSMKRIVMPSWTVAVSSSMRHPARLSTSYNESREPA